MADESTCPEKRFSVNDLSWPRNVAIIFFGAHEKRPPVETGGLVESESLRVEDQAFAVALASAWTRFTISSWNREGSF